MEVKPIPSCPGYLAGKDGLIYSQRNFNRWYKTSKEIKPLKPHDNGQGYFGVTICIDGVRRYRKIHRLVCEAFHGDVEGSEVHHIDEDRANNKPENLVALDAESHKLRHTTESAIARAIKLLTREGYTVT